MAKNKNIIPEPVNEEKIVEATLETIEEVVAPEVLMEEVIVPELAPELEPTEEIIEEVEVAEEIIVAQEEVVSEPEAEVSEPEVIEAVIEPVLEKETEFPAVEEVIVPENKPLTYFQLKNFRRNGR